MDRSLDSMTDEEIRAMAQRMAIEAGERVIAQRVVREATSEAAALDAIMIPPATITTYTSTATTIEDASADIEKAFYIAKTTNVSNSKKTKNNRIYNICIIYYLSFLLLLQSANNRFIVASKALK